MKILASIPIEKVQVSANSYTYLQEIHEVEVTRLMRWPAAKNAMLNRWHYVAVIKPHPSMAPEACNDGYNTVNVIRRRLNPNWKPPVFPEGVNTVEITND
jgi:hypothetical protein